MPALSRKEGSEPVTSHQSELEGGGKGGQESRRLLIQRKKTIRLDAMHHAKIGGHYRCAKVKKTHRDREKHKLSYWVKSRGEEGK